MTARVAPVMSLSSVCVAADLRRKRCPVLIGIASAKLRISDVIKFVANVKVVIVIAVKNYAVLPIHLVGPAFYLFCTVFSFICQSVYNRSIVFEFPNTI